MAVMTLLMVDDWPSNAKKRGRKSLALEHLADKQKRRCDETLQSPEALIPTAGSDPFVQSSSISAMQSELEQWLGIPRVFPPI